MASYKTALTIAGSDPSGGAGIQADLKAFAANNVYGLSVITALTAQNTLKVAKTLPIPVNFIEQQLVTLLSDIKIDAVKIGMIYEKKAILSILKIIRQYGLKPLVIDPVIASSSGAALIKNEALDVLITELLPLATLITPNHFEAKCLLAERAAKRSKPVLAKLLSKKFNTAVLLKGGDDEGEFSVDYLFEPETERLSVFSAKRILTKNTHGTGCTLSAAITANLAKSVSLVNAVKAAKYYTEEALLKGKGFLLGSGHGPLKHL